MVQSRRCAQKRRARLALQTLETREVPAGFIKIEMINGLLSLTGDDASNGMTIITAAGAGAGPHVKLVPTFDTTIFYQNANLQRGEPLTIDEKLVSIRATFAGGNDELVFSSELDSGVINGDPDFDIAGTVKIDMGSGDDLFAASPSGKVVFQDMNFVAGDGDNSFGMSPDKVVFQDLNFTAGDGFDQAIVSPRDAASGLPTGKRQHKPITFSFGDGGFDASVSNLTFPGGPGMKVRAGHSSGGGGAGGVDGSFTVQKVNMGGPFSGTTGEGVCSFSWGETNMGSMTYGSGGGAGKVSVTLSDGPTGKPTHVIGGVTMTGSSDLQLTVNNSTIDKGVKVQKKWLPANFRTSAMVSLSGSTAGSVDVSATGSSAFAGLTLIGSDVKGPIVVKSSGPKGMADVTVTGGPDADSSSDIGSLTVMAPGGGGSAMVEFSDFCKTGAINVQSGADATLSVFGNLAAGDPIHGVDVKLGAKSSASMSVSGDLSVAGPVSVSGGDFAQLDVGAPLGLPAAGSWRSRAVSVSSRMGEAHVRFDPLLLDIKGDMKVEAGWSCDVEIAPDPTTVDSLGGSFSVKGGSSADSVVVQDVEGIKDVLLSLGGGDNSATLRKTFSFPHVLESSGKLTVSSGNGADAIELENILISGLTKIDTGGGKDRLSVSGVATFNDLCRINTGAGDDQILIGLLMGASGPVTFQKVLTMNAGAGNDTLALGDKPDAVGGTGDGNTRVVIIDSTSLCLGSTGLDFFDAAESQVTLPQGTTLQKVCPDWETPVI